jgi:hypothetical protein
MTTQFYIDGADERENVGSSGEHLRWRFLNGNLVLFLVQPFMRFVIWARTEE